MRKCGVVIEKKLSDWLNPEDENHRLAFAFFEKYGEFPLYFLPTDIWIEHNWREKVADAFKVPKESTNHA